jgi:hypothetical protein
MSVNFTNEVLEWYRERLHQFPGEQVLKSSGVDADVLCPVHGDQNPSLGVDLRQNGKGPQIVLKCRSQGCEWQEILEAVGMKPQDLFYNPLPASEEGKEAGALEGCTLEQYAASKGLPVDFLTGEEIGLRDGTYYCSVKGERVPAIVIPYPDRTGAEVVTRFRTSLHKANSGPDTRFRWAKGAKPTLYGLNRIEEAEEAGYVLLVEGESDVHVAWYNGFPAIGVPGVKNWRDEWAEELESIGLILMPVEADEAGEKLWEKLSRCETLKGRLRRITPW